MIQVDYSRDSLFDDYAIKIMKDRYMLPSEKSPQDALARAATAFGTDEAHAQRLYDYASKHWFMFATPLLANGGTAKGLPISCFLSYIDDSIESLAQNLEENIYLSISGGGIGTSWSSVRSMGSKTKHGVEAPGIIPFMKVVDSQMLAYYQGGTRRGSAAAYLDISHPEIVEFLNMRKPTGGDLNRKCLNMHHGVNITDKFMNIVERCTQEADADDTWELVDPHSKEVVSTISAKELWERILTLRMETGEPYIHFIDTTNAAVPEVHKKLGLDVKQSNLCSEILLPTTNARTAVCCLSSLNLETYDEWKDTDIVADLVEMLDNVLAVFIEKAPDTMKRAKFSASQERSIGLGTMGFHAYLQSKNIPFESEEAADINIKIYESIYTHAVAKSNILGTERGCAKDYAEAKQMFGRRNVYLMAIAPNASTSILCGNTSPAVEPFAANSYRQETHNGINIHKNKFLDKLINSMVEDEDKKKELWKKITAAQGSIQRIKMFDKHTKEVYKTASEIDQNWIIRHAADRYKYIDQGQSINLFFDADADISYIHTVHFNAWKMGLKTLYYCRSRVTQRTEDITEKFDRKEIVAPQPVRTNFTIDCVGCAD